MVALNYNHLKPITNELSMALLSPATHFKGLFEPIDNQK